MSADHILNLSTADTMLNTITIALITWAVAVTIAIAIMVAVVVRRLRLLRARARRLANTQREDDSEYPPSEGRSSVVDMKPQWVDNQSRNEEVPNPELPRHNAAAAILADRLTNVILPNSELSAF